MELLPQAEYRRKLRQAQATGSSGLLLTGCRVLESDGASFSQSLDVRIQGQRIAELGNLGDLGSSATQAKRMNLQGMFVIPGKSAET